MTSEAVYTEQQRQKQNSRIAILDAANLCYARSGIAATTIDDIAAEAGLGRATIYRHFSNHEDILSHLIFREFDCVCQQVREIIDRSDSPASIVSAVFVHVLTEFPKLPLHQIVMREDETVFVASLFKSSSILKKLQLDIVKPLYCKIKQHGQLRSGVSLELLADWLQRVVLSMYSLPSETQDDRKAIRRYVNMFVVPSVIKPE